MSNVIRPTFGSSTKPLAEAAPGPDAEEWAPLRVYGTAAGHIVALLQDDTAPEGPVLKVVVGPETGNAIEAVAIVPATNEGQVDADMVAMAVLRALAVIGAHSKRQHDTAHLWRMLQPGTTSS